MSEAPVFKKRKRRAPTRVRSIAEEKEASDEDVSEEIDATDARLLKEAREQARRRRRGLGAQTANDAALLGEEVRAAPVERAVDVAPVPNAGVKIGLSDTFAVQSSTATGDERSKVERMRDAHVAAQIAAEKQRWRQEALAATGGNADQMTSSAGDLLSGAIGEPILDEAQRREQALAAERAELFAVPEHLRAKRSITSVPPPADSEAVSASLLEEVELPVEYKWRNVLETEKAKAAMIAEERRKRRQRKNDANKSNVPANFSTRRAANSVYSANSDGASSLLAAKADMATTESNAAAKTQQSSSSSNNQNRSGSNRFQRATDDLAMGRFRKHQANRRR